VAAEAAAGTMAESARSKVAANFFKRSSEAIW